MQKLTRREIVIATASLASSVAARKLLAQAPAPANNTDLYKEALESHKENSGILSQFQVPMSVEPACQFKA
jgi:hypothetical protein